MVRLLWGLSLSVALADPDVVYHERRRHHKVSLLNTGAKGKHQLKATKEAPVEDENERVFAVDLPDGMTPQEYLQQHRQVDSWREPVDIGDIAKRAQFEENGDKEAPTRYEMQVLNAKKAHKAAQLKKTNDLMAKHLEALNHKEANAKSKTAEEEAKSRKTPQIAKPVTKQQHPVSKPHTANMMVMEHTHTRQAPAAGGSGSVGSGAGGPPANQPVGYDQCVNFSRKMKAQNLTGQEMIRAWRTTCEPAAHTGGASERYKLMCDSLIGAVEPFAGQPDFDVYEMCTHVLTVFHDVIVP